MWSLVFPFLHMAFIFLLSSIPGGEKEAFGYHFSLPAVVGNLLHLPLYFVLGLLWRQAFEARGVPGRRGALLAVGLATLFGALDEVHQSFVPRRTAAWLDVALDLVGAAAGSLAWPLFRRLFPGRRPGGDRGFEGRRPA